jgi:hypothetical protein
MTADAKAIAKELDRRRLRRRLVWLAIWGTAIVLAAIYLRCGRGWGTGGKGPGSGGTASSSDHHRCMLRVSAGGITVDDKPATREQAVGRCKVAGGADVIVTGDARQGDWDELRRALDDGKVPMFVHDGH